MKGTSVGTKRQYNIVSQEKIARVMEVNFQARTEAKIKWVVNNYNEWHEMRLDHSDCDDNILYSDLREVNCLEKDEFEMALCSFICEVKKSREEGDYPRRTLYQMACAIQNYLKKKGKNWHLVHGDEFMKFNRVLDSVMQERANKNIGTVRKQAQVISIEFENQLWERNILGEDTQDKLRNTVLYLLGVNLALRAGDEHYALRRPGCKKGSQLSFGTNELNVRCLVYHEDSVTKTNRGGLCDMKKERKVVWIKPNTSWERCPIRLIEKYIQLLPINGNRENFYLQSLKKPRPYCWYATCPIGINSLRKVVATMLKDAGLDGFFTNHSLRRTCATRLFQGGQDVKIVKEITGHISDVVHKYQQTSDVQRMNVSLIIQNDKDSVKLSEASPMEVVPGPSKKDDHEVFKLKPFKLPICEGNEGKRDDVDRKSETMKQGICNVIEAAMKSVGKRRAKVTVEVELIE